MVDPRGLRADVNISEIRAVGDINPRKGFVRPIYPIDLPTNVCTRLIREPVDCSRDMRTEMEHFESIYSKKHVLGERPRVSHQPRSLKTKNGAHTSTVQRVPILAEG